MQFKTDRKRAEGLGSARAGTHHHWKMMFSSAVLIVLVPLFIFTFGPALGRAMRRCWPISHTPSRPS